MKRFFSSLAILCLLLCCSATSRANHIFGGDLLYTNILNDTTYIVKLTLYGDCAARLVNPTLIPNLYIATPRIKLYNGTTLIDTFDVKLVPGSGIDVSPVCPGQLSQTECNNGNLPGVRQFIYIDTIRISVHSASLRFVFDGNALNPGQAGRSASITNVSGNLGLIELEADLNNTLAPNSSPQYATIPTPFYCVNVPEQYNQGAADPNGDSLVYSLVPGVNGQYGTPLIYQYPRTASQPLSTGTGGFFFNPLNGQMSFTGNTVQDALVVNKVSEYRNGVLVGSSQREMTFIFQDNCDGVAPTAVIANLHGATVTNNTVINICKNAPFVSFSINIDNPDGDTTYLTPSNVPASATLTVTNDSTPHPGANFSWNTDTLSTGAYSFFLTIKNNHCPLYNTQTIAYTINVAYPPTINATQLSATQCLHQAAVEFDVFQGFLPRTITIMQGSTVIKTITDSTGTTASGIVIDSLYAGSYVAIVSSDSLCTGSVSFTIADSGLMPHIDADQSLCRGDASVPISITPVGPGATIQWYAASGFSLAGAPLPNTYAPATFTWYFIENYRSCTTGPDTVHVTVHELPVVTILNIPHTVCYGDDIYLKASGGVSYTWQPESAIQTDTGGLYVHVLSPVTVIATATDSNSCRDSAAVTYSDIQPCCNFSYPTAFTPNNDGNNDGFRIVTYGNMLHYSLSIYNRWGQWVFWTGDPDHKWDGNFGGQPCETGVYYYIMQGQCLTGQKQEHKGEVTLIR